MMFLASHGFRTIAHDRRGHGRSDQPWDGNDMNAYADDLAALIDDLDLRDAVLVGHSTGGGEVARHVARHGTGRVARVVLLAAVPPLMLRTADNPDGTPKEVFDDIRSEVQGDDDQIVSPAAASKRQAELIPGAELIVYPGAPHGLAATHKDRVNADLLRFIRG